MAGAWITLIGAALTIIINYLFIPRYGYMACAWATFVCYGSMMVMSFLWGQKEYPVPYAWKKLLAYMVIVLLLYFTKQLFLMLGLSVWVNRGFSLVLIGLFLLLILKVEKKELQRLPYLDRFFKPTAV